MPKPRTTDPTQRADKPPKPARVRARAADTPGDDVGAAELAQKVAANLRQMRKARGLSLDELSAASGVSRAALSQIETSKTNPTVGVLWKVAVGLGVPFAELLATPKSGVVLLRREDAQVLRSLDGKLESRPLTPAGASPLVELYELRLAARATHRSEAHAPGTHELITVLTGQLRVHLEAEVHELAAGDTIAFPADRAHAYENPGSSEARYHNVIAYAR